MQFRQKYIIIMSSSEAGNAHDETVSKVSPMGKSLGNASHQAYLKACDGSEFLVIDLGNAPVI